MSVIDYKSRQEAGALYEGKWFSLLYSLYELFQDWVHPLVINLMDRNGLLYSFYILKGDLLMVLPCLNIS